MGDNKKKSVNMTALIGAAFLMATSAIGPGFLTQTATFTGTYGATFALAIICTILLDVTTQFNIWSIIGVSGLRGQDIANKVLPGLGYFIAFLVSLGGLVFNIGNVGGAATGFNILFGLPLAAGTVIAGAIGILIFLSKDAKASVANVGELPNLVFPIITLLGGSCGGYITFSGAHRLLDAGFKGEEDLGHVRRSVLMGVSVSGVMRILLFLAVLGVVTMAPEIVGSDGWVASPPAAAFQAGAGVIGYKIFGLVILFAAITSIIGAAYTSVSFLKTLHPFIMENEKWFVIGFIAVSTVIMAFAGQPAVLLVLAGSVNGLILPITLLTILCASRRKDIVGDHYKHPAILIVLGVLVVLLTGYSGIKALPQILTIFG